MTFVFFKGEFLSLLALIVPVANTVYSFLLKRRCSGRQVKKLPEQFDSSHNLEEELQLTNLQLNHLIPKQNLNLHLLQNKS